MDKWQFTTNQNWEVLRDNFDSVSSDTIPDNNLQALCFHFFSLGYFDQKVLSFVDVTDNPDLTIKPVENGQSITNSEDEKVKK